MSANTTIWVKVQRPAYDWVEVSALTLEDAIKKVEGETGFLALQAQYEDPHEKERGGG